MKRSLIARIRAICHSILGDRTVFMLIVILHIFDYPDPQVVRIREQYRNVLRYDKTF